MAATNEDLARLLVSIEFTQKQSAKQLAAIAKSGGDAATGIENRFRKANDNVGKSFDAGGKKVVQSIGAQRAAVSNLSFQLNDIAMGLASGTSPFTIMAQQGSQVSQALQGSGGILGAVKTLGGALTSMVNPVSLASFALIGLTGAAVQYLTTLSSGVPDVDKYLKEHGEVIKSFEAAWGIAEKGAKEYTAAARQVELQKLRDEFGSTTEAAKALAGELSDDILSGSTAKILGGSTKSVSDFSRALGLLEQDIPDFRQFSIEMAKIADMKGLPDPIRNLATELRLAAQDSIPLQEHLEKVVGHLKVIRLSGEEAKQAFGALTSAAIGLGGSGAGAIGSVADKIRTDLIPAMATAIEQVGTFIKNYGTLQEQVNRTSLGSISPVFSGGGQFLNPDQLQTFNAGEARYREAGESAAASMIKGFEGFISTAKWDVNAFRTGFGSDTVTRLNGNVEKVTKDTVVTLAEAQRDLSRRLVEFQSGIQSAIGVETWKSLSDAQQAALSSIAYNYGSLPKSIVAAIQQGGGPEVVAQAIANLSSNPGRRKQEAQSYLNGTGISMSDAGLGKAKKTPEDLFKGDLAQVEKRIALLNAEYAAQAQLNPLVEDYGYAVEKARIEQQLLSEAQAAGLTVTPELAATIGTLAENYARASAASGQLKNSQQQAADSAKAFGDASKDIVGGFISDLRSGMSAAEAFAGALDKIADKLINLALDSIFGGGGGLMSLFGFADGGIAAKGRPQPLKTFARGGTSNTAAIFGEAGPEAAVPLPDGRSIPVTLKAPSLPGRGQGGGSSSYAPTYNIDARGADQAAVARLERGLEERDRTEGKRVAGYNQKSQSRKVRP